jgi:hypothetical protein
MNPILICCLADDRAAELRRDAEAQRPTIAAGRARHIAPRPAGRAVVARSAHLRTASR